MLSLVLMTPLLVVLSLGAEPTKPTHVVIVFVDDFGWGDLSCQGNTLAKTPSLDRMAREGVRFTQGYVASPICSPSRCGLLTGQFPARWRINSYLQTRAGNKACEMTDFLDPRAPTLPRLLKNSGFATAHIGKWHLGGGRDVKDAPKFAAYGYDRGIGTWESPEPHPDLTSTNWIWAKTDKVKRHERTRWMVDRTLDFIKENKGKPSFVNLWLDDTHTPFVPATTGTDVERYVAVLTEMDRQIGRLLDGLKGTNTLVLLIGDNGAAPTFEQKRVAGLRGQKLSLYEGGVRVPFLAWWPGITRPGVNESTVIATVDLLPSLAHLCGAKRPADQTFDGEDLSAALLGKAVKRTKPLFWEYGRNNKSFAYPPLKVNRSPNVAVRDGDWKLLVMADGSGAELYDLSKDRQETKNVATDHRDVVDRLQKMALTWRKSLP